MPIWTVDTHVSVTVEAEDYISATEEGGRIIENVLAAGNAALDTSAYIGDDVDAWQE